MYFIHQLEMLSSEGKVGPFIHFVRLLSCTSHCIREMSCHTTLNSLEGYIVLVAVKYLFKVLICVVVVFVHVFFIFFVQKKLLQ